MPVITERQRALIGRESEPRDAPYVINDAMTHFWCEMVEDANPIYFDPSYARTTWLGDTFAPPPMLLTWMIAPVWPEVPRETAISRLALDDCPATVAVNAVQEYMIPLRYGDRLASTTRIDSISDEKTTRLGTGHFVSTVDTFRNQRGDIVGTHTFTLFIYRPHPAGGAP